MLDTLMLGAREDAERRATSRSRAELEARVASLPAPIDALAALQSREIVHVIAEVKRASPSKGPLADIPEPAALARSYEQGGASIISVLTEERRFLGSLSDLEAVRAAVSIPVLRKDFISTEYQILEARAAGADLILLIVAGLSNAQLRSLYEFARSLDLQVLVEVHSESELHAAIALEAQIIGVNARNLSTFEVDTSLFATLHSQIPSNAVAVAESGVSDVRDVERYKAAGAHAVLVGEALVKDGTPADRVTQFRSA
ncbi:indole-3-glycerol phosphate synthase TrpC [Humidisolicoccus flavus]